LLAPTAQPAALAGAMLRLLGGPDYARELGGAGRQLVRDGFSLSQMIEQTTALYEEVGRERKGYIRPFAPEARFQQ
jgi:glycosyltransferase involved in cell wall biosynthesis